MELRPGLRNNIFWLGSSGALNNNKLCCVLQGNGKWSSISSGILFKLCKIKHLDPKTHPSLDHTQNLAHFWGCGKYKPYSKKSQFIKKIVRPWLRIVLAFSTWMLYCKVQFDQTRISFFFWSTPTYTSPWLNCANKNLCKFPPNPSCVAGNQAKPVASGVQISTSFRRCECLSQTMHGTQKYTNTVTCVFITNTLQLQELAPPQPPPPPNTPRAPYQVPKQETSLMSTNVVCFSFIISLMQYI